VGVPIQKENEVPLGPVPRRKGRRIYREEVSLLINSGAWESVMSSPSGVRCEALAENGFIVI